MLYGKMVWCNKFNSIFGGINRVISRGFNTSTRPFPCCLKSAIFTRINVTKVFLSYLLLLKTDIPKTSFKDFIRYKTLKLLKELKNTLKDLQQRTLKELNLTRASFSFFKNFKTRYVLNDSQRRNFIIRNRYTLRSLYNTPYREYTGMTMWSDILQSKLVPPKAHDKA